MGNYSTLSIDLSVIEKNLDFIKKIIPPRTRIMAMVKASSYGTDNFRIASFFLSHGIDILGVAHIQEAIYLRNKGISAPIFVVHAYENDAKDIAAYDLEVGLSDLNWLKRLSEQPKEIKVHLHIDTGMKRFGCRPEEALFLAQQIIKQKNVKFEGIMTHFTSAEAEKFDPFSRQQENLFIQILNTFKQENILPPWIHAQNSSATLRFKMPYCNMVRVGFAFLGYLSENLLPSLTLKTKIVNINVCKKNESVGYNNCYIATRDGEKIAVIPMGYYDGIPLNLSGKGYALINGKKAPFVGKICMDYMMLNVTDILDAKLGSEVLLFGKDMLGNSLTLQEFASWGNTDPREITTGVGPRVTRIFHE